ncbi:AMP-binding protein, partial [Methanobrevibacter sp.]
VNDRDDLIADFSVNVSQKSSKYTLSIMYSDKYSRDVVERFAQTYNLILSKIMSVNELSEINYITDSDIELLNAYNETEYDLAYVDVLDAFNDNLNDFENKVLVSYDDNSYTHGESAFIANEISSVLFDYGVVKQDFVALFVNRSEWFLLASLGVLTCDAIYVPIDTTYPDERIIFMLEDSNSRVVIVDDDSEQRMLNIISQNNLDIDVFNVFGILDNGISSSGHLNNVEICGNDVACVLYTSGTTGIPKGVLVTRKALNNFVSWYVDETNFTSDDVYG